MLDNKKLTELKLTAANVRKHILTGVHAAASGHPGGSLSIADVLTLLYFEVMNTSPDEAKSPDRDRFVLSKGHCAPALYGVLAERGYFPKEDIKTLRKTGSYLQGHPDMKAIPGVDMSSGSLGQGISAANGMAKAKKLTDEDGYTVAVIGDGALTGGLAYEGLSNAGRSDDKLIVVLNDNQMSISPNVGFAARHLANLRTRPRYVKFKNVVATVFKHIPFVGKPLYRLLLTGKNSMKRAIFKDISFFEDMGFYYIGPVNGHDIMQLAHAFETARTFARPVVIHAETVKGKGYAFAEKDPGTYHGVGRFDPAEKLVLSVVPSFSTVFGETLDTLADEDARIVGITAAMKHGTCITKFADRVPSRCFDTGIAEAHAVTFASGMAAGGLTPVFAVYSTFLQRAYDQLLNDTAIMNNHIVLAVDRAGIVPDEGETHQGVFDVAFLTTVPNTTIYAPATFRELKLHLKQAIYDEQGIAAVRYPRGGEPSALRDYTPDYAAYRLEEAPDADTLVITYGREYANVLSAAAMMAQNNRPVSVLKLNRIFPLTDAMVDIAVHYRRVVFVEEGARRGGLGEYFASRLLENGFKGTYTVRAIEGFLPPCTLEDGMKRCGLDADSVYALLANEDVV